MSRLTAAERFRRIVAIVPWIAERDGPRIDDVCARFGIDRDDLLQDLDVVFMVGIPPYTPDELIDVMIDDDRVWVTLGRYFTRPQRLTPREALGILAAGSVLMATTGAEPDGPLARGLAKLRAAVGIEGTGTVEVELGDADPAVLDVLRTGNAELRSVDIEYYTYATDETRERRIDPYRVHATDGNWYVTGWCHLAGAERRFRVDRIRRADATDAPFELPAVLPEATAYSGSGLDRRIAIEVEPAARWVAGHYPTESVTELDGGRLRIVLSVGGDAWLERLLVRLGPDARIVDIEPPDPSWTMVSRAEGEALLTSLADSMLARYR